MRFSGRFSQTYFVPPEQAPLLGGGLGLGAPHAIDGLAEQLHHVEAVDRLGGPGHLLRHPQGVGLGHVAGRLAHGRPVPAARLQLVAEPADGGPVPAGGDGDDPPRVEVDHRRYVVLPAPARGVVYPHAAHPGVVGRVERLPDGPRQDGPDPRVAHAELAGDLRRRHPRRRHHEDLHLEQGREVGVRAHLPRHARRQDAVLGAVDAGHRAVHDGLVLPYVQVAPRALARVVDPAPRVAGGALDGHAGHASHAHVQLVGLLPCAGFEPDVLDAPLGPQAHRPLEKGHEHPRALVHHGSSPRSPPVRGIIPFGGGAPRAARRRATH